MTKLTKKHKEILEQVDRNKLYPPKEAIETVKKLATAKFDETLEVHFRLGIDPRKSDQTVRGTVVLPHGTGKTPRVIVFTKGEKITEAEDAGAMEVGSDELIARVKKGWMDFDVAVASPDMMGQLGKELGRILGPRMPNPKAGTVSMDIGKTVKELMSGKIQYRTDKLGIIHCPLGKVSFDTDKLIENFNALLSAIVRSRPPAAKGTYLKSITFCSTMGPGVRVDPGAAQALLRGK
ncbi:MAG: 50S ribosomal protein L1 [Candidatus Eremiobacteraeota bacterium]|nr:50S ribosomal protein L1 [Candidatus Eremiobacteraeota bacterium]